MYKPKYPTEINPVMLQPDEPYALIDIAAEDPRLIVKRKPGRPKSAEPMSTICLRIPQRVEELARHGAQESRLSLSAFFVRAVEHELEAKPQKQSAARPGKTA